MQYDNLGKFIRRKRESLCPKVSLNSFAINNDIEPAILSRIETQQQGIKLNILEKISQGFNLKLSEFLAEYETTEIKD